MGAPAWWGRTLDWLSRSDAEPAQPMPYYDSVTASDPSGVGFVALTPQEHELPDPTSVVWCTTCAHEHVGNMPSVTWVCKDCGFGSWHAPVADSHREHLPTHRVVRRFHALQLHVPVAAMHTLRSTLETVRAERDHAQLLLRVVERVTAPACLPTYLQRAISSAIDLDSESENERAGRAADVWRRAREGGPYAGPYADDVTAHDGPATVIAPEDPS